MSYDRREFLKSLTLGGLALFTADWFKRVEETKAASAGKLLPALPGQKVSAKGDQIRAFWASDHFELCLNGTIYDEVPDFEDEDAEEFDDSEFEQDEEESEEEFEERVQEAATSGRASTAPSAKVAGRITSSTGTGAAVRGPRRCLIYVMSSMRSKRIATGSIRVIIATSAASNSMTAPSRAMILMWPPRRRTMRPSPPCKASSSP